MLEFFALPMTTSLKWNAADHAEALEHFKNLIRIDTTNPPGNELAACQYLAQIFDKEGIPYQILESVPGRANIVARLKGTGGLKPLLLTSHLDVVPCEREYWDVDPFEALEKDGFIWGRGTVDMKNMTVMELTVFLKFHREKIPHQRDLIFAAVADEEVSCEHGSKFLVDQHPDLVQAEYALNEVGGFSLDVDGQTFYPIGVAEKGVCWFKIKAKGQAGHGAMPHDHQALPHLCFAAHQLAENKLPFHDSKVVKDFIDELAKRQPFPKNLVLKSITKPLLSDFVLNNLYPDPERARNFKNMFRNLATPTIMTAGQKTNVIPGTAELTVDGRILPEQTVEGFLTEIKQLIGPQFEIEVIRAEEANQTDYNNSCFDTLKRVLEVYDPGCIPIPFLIPGYTDAKHYSRLGIKCYGFAPTKLPAGLNFGALYHGHNERIPVASIEFGTQVLGEAVLQIVNEE